MTLTYKNYVVQGTAEELKEFIEIMDRETICTSNIYTGQLNSKYYEKCPACGSTKLFREKRLGGAVICNDCGNIVKPYEPPFPKEGVK